MLNTYVMSDNKNKNGGIKMEKLRSLVIENQDKIKDEILKAYEEAEDLWESWRIDIQIDDNGEVWATGALSQGSQTMSSWKGETHVVASVHGWQVGGNNYDYDFKEDIKYQDNYDKIIADFEEAEEKDEAWDLYEFVQVNYPEVIENMDSEYREYLFSDEFHEQAHRKIDEFILSLDERIGIEKIMYEQDFR